MITAIYPGTFDPVTNGHVDVIQRAAGIFDRLVIGVVGHPQHKEPMFTLDERVAFLNQALDGLKNVEVDVFSELVVDFARKHSAWARWCVCIRTACISGRRVKRGAFR